MRSSIKYVRSNFVILGGRGWILAMWIAHFILFLFCNQPAKNVYSTLMFTAELPLLSSHTNHYAFSWTTLSPSERTYFMDDPFQDRIFHTPSCLAFTVLYVYIDTTLLNLISFTQSCAPVNASFYLVFMTIILYT